MIEEILMKRDSCTKNEAKMRIQECRRRLQVEAIPTGDYGAAEDIIAEELGLEPDYIIELL